MAMRAALLSSFMILTWERVRKPLPPTTIFALPMPTTLLSSA